MKAGSPWISIILFSTARVAILASILPGQDGDNILSPIIDPAIGALGEWVVGPVIDGIVTSVETLKDLSEDSNRPDPTPFAVTKDEPSQESKENTPYQLRTHQDIGEILGLTQSQERDSTPDLVNSESCNYQRTNPVLYFPLECANFRNEEITAPLTEWVTTNGFWISHDDECREFF